MGIFSFLKKKDKVTAEQPVADPVSTEETQVPGDQIETSEPLDTRLKKSRSRFAGGLLDFLGGRTKIDEDLLDDLEAQLIMSDIGVATAERIISAVRQSARNNAEPDLQKLLRQQLIEILQPCEQALQIPEMSGPFVLLIVGVNGAGKTTTIGKIARQLQNGEKSVLLAAGDTFRAAAVEQLQTWGQRNNIPVVAQGTGADSASVIFDAVQSAKAKDIDVVIADTAGRLHTQAGLMDELAKVARVIKKFDDTAPHETLLVLDGTTGQNGLNQAREFSAKVNVTGLVVTKLDGSAKGGMLFTLADELKLPIRFIGVGEGIYDLRVFEAGDFVDALLGDTSPDGSIHGS
jgi:fused signal recognition particle receptor